MNWHSCFLCGPNKVEKLKYFKFPNVVSKQEQWVQELRMTTVPNKNARFCERHFALNEKKKITGFVVPLEGEVTSREITRSKTVNRSKRCILCGVNKDGNTSYFRFPENSQLRAEWIQACNAAEPISSKERLCAKHFQNSDISYSGVRVRLKPSAVPSIFFGLVIEVNNSRTSASSSVASENEGVLINVNQHIENSSSQKKMDAADSVLTSSPTLKNSLSEENTGTSVLANSLSEELSQKRQIGHILPNNHLDQSTPSKNSKFTFSEDTSDVTYQTCTVVEHDQSPMFTGNNLPYTSTPITTRVRTVRYPGDVQPTDVATPRRATRNLNKFRQKMKEMQTTIKRLQIQLNREKAKVTNLEDALNECRRQRHISDSLCNNLKDSLPVAFVKAGLRSLKSKTAKYEPEIRQFALTLHFYSPKAYKFVRRHMRNVLPSVSSLRRWFCSNECKPGFSEEILRFLKFRAETKEKPIICNLVLDEMSIRQQLIIKNKKQYGAVDLGFGNNRFHNLNLTDEEDCDDPNGENCNQSAESVPIAKNALVILLVALNDSWKVPIAYFLLDSLSGSERASLVMRALTLLHEHQVHVRSFTFDGANVNFNMATHLGACLDVNSTNFRPFFSHPVTNKLVYAFPDPSHSLKNVRNSIGATLKLNKEDNTWQNFPFYDEDGNEIAWRHIKLLVDTQRGELHTANKLSERHINFHENPMNVRLAVQTLSNSTATSLRYMEIVEPQFQGSSGTSKFCTIFNNAFDILNCRNSNGNPLINPYQVPINEKTKEGLEVEINNIIKYIQGLTIHNGKLITESRKKCGFIGFIVCLKNIISLYNDLAADFGLQYLLSYKISQDHIENLFSCIRMKGGYNNNPNAFQFYCAFRRLLIHHEVTSSDSSNCTADETPILFVTTLKKKKVDNTVMETDFREKFNLSTDVVLSTYIEDIVDYIGGFIIRKIEKKLSAACEVCATVIQDPRRDSALIDCKTKGYLKKPSKELNQILYILEQFIRANELKCFSPNFADSCTETVKNLLNSSLSDVFLISEDGVSHDFSHQDTLIELIVDYYLQIRLHHEAKILSEVDKRIRRTFTNLIKFKGQ